MRMRCGCGLALPSLLLFSVSVLAQQSAPPTGDGAIHLAVVVSQKDGAAVPELRQEDFHLLDNRSPTAITSFHAVSSDEPVEVILVIDAVNAGFQVISNEQQQLTSFLQSNAGRLPHPTALALLTDNGIKAQQGFSTDGNALAADLNGNQIGLHTIPRSAGFYGASERYQLSLDGLGRLVQQESRVPGRKLIVWISPGWAFFSGPNIQIDNKQQQTLFQGIVTLSTQMRQAGITLYSIDPRGTGAPENRNFYYQEFVKGVGKQNQAQPGDLSLQVLAEQTGGLVLFSDNRLGNLLKTCYDDTRAYYEISFLPERADGPAQFHSIDVKVDRSGLTTRTRDGYYTQP